MGAAGAAVVVLAAVVRGWGCVLYRFDVAVRMMWRWSGGKLAQGVVSGG